MQTKLSFEDFYNSIWLKIPEVWRNADDENGKALQLLVYTMAQHMYYYYYSKIVAMDELFDPDLCPGKYLKFLSSMVGWTLVGTDEKSWREQIKAAPLLYKIKGTKRGIALAERLVGYSVFMSELYRDHLGDLVPKERIFNNIPSEITNKPWFKSVSMDASGKEITGTLESDLFDSYNANDSHLNSFGRVVRPLTKTNTKTIVTSRKLSTTSLYNPITGSGSLARYAKTPRINVVLRRTEPLDSVDSDSGNIKSSNIEGALDLLLRFKPFHVYVNNIDVLFDLSDYVFGCSVDVTAGTGENPAETINFRENFDFSIYIDSDKELGETITYRPESEDTVPVSLWSPKSTAPVTSAEIKTFSLYNLPKISDIQQILNLGFSTKGFVSLDGKKYGYGILDGRIVTKKDDFLLDEAIFSEASKSIDVDYVDAATRSIKLRSLPVIPTFSFRTLDLSSVFSSNLYDFRSSFISKHSLYSEICPTISDITLSKYSQKDAVTVTYGNKTEIQSYLTGMPWDLKNISAFRTITGDKSTNLQYLNNLFLNTFVLILVNTKTNRRLILSKQHYRLRGQTLILDTVGITNSLTYSEESSDDFLQDCSLHVLFLTQSKESDDFSGEKTSRAMYVNKRNHKMFSRQYSVLSDRTKSSDHIKSVDQFTFNTETGALDYDAAHTKVYKTELPRIFTRGSLRKASVEGSNNTPVIVKNILNVCNPHQWKVYSKLYTSYYSGSERVSNTWWTDFYQVGEGTQNDNYLVDYSSIDTSYDSHEKNRNSSRWQTALKTLDTANPDHFLATRKSSTNREAIWTRGSALRMAYPFSGDNRRLCQSNRSGKVLFARDENLSDYATQITTPSNISNFKYVLSDTNIDLSKSYFNPVFSDSSNAIPRVENLSASKLVVNSTSEYSFTVGPLNTTSYDGSMSFVDRLGYYSDKTQGSLYTSVYAGNMMVRNYPQKSGLMYDDLDKLDMMVEGLLPVIDTFEVTQNNNDEIQSEFILTYSDLFISWYKKYTGQYLNSGNYPLSSVETAVPNIKVYINGIQVLYSDVWTLTLDVLKSIKISASVQPHDIVKVEYFTMSKTVRPGSPGVDQLRRTNRTVVTDQLLSQVSKTLFRLPLQTTLMVSWYDRITGGYISTSYESSDLMPAANYKTAVPDVKVLLNGIELKYIDSWYFIVSASGDIFIELSTNTSYKLAVNDIIEIQYEVRKN